MMLCSIVIALYNKESYIRLALRSVLNQTYGEFEIVIVDDGSTDGSVAVVNSFNDPRIRLIRQSNLGVSRARNAGIRHATGELITFLDADDWYDRHYLQVIVDMARQYPERTFYATGFRYVLDYQPQNWDGLLPTPVPVELVDDFYLKRFRTGFFFCTNSVAIKSTDLKTMQPCFPENEQMGEDQDLWFRLAESMALAFCSLPLAAYRSNVQNSLCDTIVSETLLPVFVRLEQRAAQNLLDRKSKHSALLLVADERLTIARGAFASGHRATALLELLRAHRVIIKKRWWWTLLMCLVGTPTMLINWEHRRDRRFETGV